MIAVKMVIWVFVLVAVIRMRVAVAGMRVSMSMVMCGGNGRQCGIIHDGSDKPDTCERERNPKDS